VAIKFGISSSRNISFHYEDESIFSDEDWAEMSEAERDAALMDYLNANVEVWVVGN
jgi:hypothetical protein